MKLGNSLQIIAQLPKFRQNLIRNRLLLLMCKGNEASNKIDQRKTNHQSGSKVF